jgi:hypothetical protein
MTGYYSDQTRPDLNNRVQSRKRPLSIPIHHFIMLDISQWFWQGALSQRVDDLPALPELR